MYCSGVYGIYLHFSGHFQYFVRCRRDKPNEVSDAERISLLYNASCCLARLDRPLDGLEALAVACEAGFEDIPQMKRDPDLEALREHPAIEGLLARFEKQRGVVTDFLSGFLS